MLDLQDAISLFEEGEPRQAADLLEKLAAEMPGYATARVLLARSYEQLNDWDAALGAWREAHQIIPNSPVVRRGLQRAARKTKSRSPIGTPQTSETPTWGGVPEENPDQPDAQNAGPEPTPAAYADEPAVQIEPELRAPPEVRRDEPHVRHRDEPHERRGDEPHKHHRDEPDARPPGAMPEPTEPEAAEPTPEPASESTPAQTPEARPEDYEDLDRLISELESARIVPRPDLENVPPPDLEDDIEDVVSETLARIYASQGQYEEAAHVYELLADQKPDKADEFRDKASDMRSRASEQE